MPTPLTTTTFIGFDSAWSDNPRIPGAICALRMEPGEAPAFTPPILAGFAEATALILGWHARSDMTLLAIDQPTIVPNETGARPAERAVASVISWSGGGIQPAFRGKTSMFGDGAPIWRLLDAIGFADDPEAASRATHGGYVMEVFPALALLSFEAAFTAAGKRGPRYNPSRPTFRQADWAAVLTCAIREALRLALPEVAAWCETLDFATKPRKVVQDRLDSVLCLLIGVMWRRERARCAMIGDLAAGYIVAPVCDVVRARLESAARERGVPMR